MKTKSSPNYLAAILIFNILGFGASAAFFTLNDRPPVKQSDTAPVGVKTPQRIVVEAASEPPSAQVASAQVASAPPFVPPTELKASEAIAAPLVASAVQVVKTVQSQPVRSDTLNQKTPLKSGGQSKNPQATPSSGSGASAQPLNAAQAVTSAFKPTVAAEVRVHASNETAKPPAATAAPAIASSVASAAKPSKHESAVDTPKPIIAEPLVKTPFKPVLVTANSSRVWVKVDERKTYVYERGEVVPGFGTFKEFDGKAVKFDSGSYNLSSTGN